MEVTIQPFSHIVWSVIGIILSLYAFYVEHRKSHDRKYTALCDISERMSCSKVLTSRYSRGFGLAEYVLGENHTLNIPNCVVGIAFYSIQIILGTYWHTFCGLLYYLTMMSCVASVYLAYILVFRLRAVCIVCVATYGVNAVLLYINYTNCY